MGRPARKKGAIERAALELFVEKGVDGTSIRDIALRAGVTEGALYRHHRSKSDLVRALFREHHEGLAEVIRRTQTPPGRFDELMAGLVRAFFELHDTDRHIFHFLMVTRHQVLDEARRGERNPAEWLAAMIREAQERGEIPPQDAELTTQLLLGMILQAAAAHHAGQLRGALTDHADAVVEACATVAHRGGTRACAGTATQPSSDSRAH